MIFSCPGLESDITSEQVIQTLFQKEGETAHALLAAAQYEQQKNDSLFITFPIGLTLETEAFGGKVTQDANGRRISQIPFHSIEEMLLSQPCRVDQGIVRETMAAIRMTREEAVILKVSGASAVLLNLIGMAELCRAMRKKPKLLHKALGKINDWLFHYIQEGLKQGVSIISFSDTGCSFGLLRQKDYQEFVGDYQVELFARLQRASYKGVIHVCGVTSAALQNSGFITMSLLDGKGMSLGKSLLEMAKREEVAFFGHSCLKQEKKKMDFLYQIHFLNKKRSD